MELPKQDKIILPLLVNIQTELLTIKDYILKSMEVSGELSKEEKHKKLIEMYDNDRKYYQNSIIASLKNNYDDTLGNINDLLNVSLRPSTCCKYKAERLMNLYVHPMR